LSRSATALEHSSQAPAAIPGGWPLLGHAGALLRDPLGFLERAYPLGEVVALRLGPKPACLVNGSEPLRRILVADAASYDKGFQFDQLRTLIGDGVGTSAGAKHRRQRRLMRPAFDHGHVEGHVAAMAHSAAQAADGWRAADRTEIDAGQEMRSLTMTVITRAMFGTADWQGADAAAVREVLASLPVLLGGIGRRALLPVALLNNAPTPGNRRFVRAQAGLHRLADRMVAEHRARQRADGPGAVAGSGLVSTLLAAVDEDGSGMTDEQAHDEIMTVLLAGTETSAGTLAWTLHVLSREPDLQHAVQQEADTVLGGRLPTAADLGSLTLIRRVVSEVLRLHPAGWILGRRPVEDVEIAGVPVRAGTQVLLNFYGLHRDPRAYPDPDRFDPDRWLDPDPEVLRGHYLPFGLGPHACIGEGFAWSQILTTAAVIASRYTLRPVPGSVVKPVARTTLHPGVVPLVLEPR
jgi:cytochrome P450